ncbi:hypothetical protein [Xenorhabdus bovienii]|uniref:Uncharacterized protein n=1 Tax=Xenorhabdus bovienii str. kraussei Becker Underwood TaxID=1398204 RepID=A0A077PUL6_XENBV|nr:hypothetical protein [Xenorhabdus bovienii]CDH24382.1 hypothetical protein XBKB1_2710003 [Xenorhabdus bovienii str. kraussei Becker Underwood]
MSDIYNHLVRNNFNAMSTEEIKDLRKHSEGAHSAVMAALSSIGELGFWAEDNENYSKEQARDDLRSVSEALMYLPKIAKALNDTERHAQIEIYHREGSPKW